MLEGAIKRHAQKKASETLDTNNNRLHVKSLFKSFQRNNYSKLYVYWNVLTRVKSLHLLLRRTWAMSTRSVKDFQATLHATNNIHIFKLNLKHARRQNVILKFTLVTDSLLGEVKFLWFFEQNKKSINWILLVINNW